MKSFKVRISDRLYFREEDQKRSHEIRFELNRLEKELPGIKLKMEELRDGKYWLACEAHRKAIRLSYSPEKLKELQADLWHLENQMNGPLQEHADQCRKLVGENGELTRGVKKEIIEFLDKYLEEVRGSQSARTVDSEKWFVDRGAKGEVNILVRTVEDNFGNIDKIVNLLTQFKSKVRSEMNYFSSGEIIVAVKNFEDEINKIDINVTEKREISESEWRDLKESKLI
jgi:predicted nuclease with TOPRIM domain